MSRVRIPGSDLGLFRFRCRLSILSGHFSYQKNLSKKNESDFPLLFHLLISTLEKILPKNVKNNTSKKRPGMAQIEKRYFEDIFGPRVYLTEVFLELFFIRGSRLKIFFSNRKQTFYIEHLKENIDPILDTERKYCFHVWY